MEKGRLLKLRRVDIYHGDGAHLDSIDKFASSSSIAIKSFFTIHLLTRFPFFCLVQTLFYLFQPSSIPRRIMISPIYTLLLGSASLVAAYPVIEKRVVTALDQAAFEEAQQRDDTATRAFSSVPIKVC